MGHAPRWEVGYIIGDIGNAVIFMLVASLQAMIMTKDEFIDLALSFPWVESRPHFERIGFKIANKKMFTTYLEKDNSANIFLTTEEQNVFCKINTGIYPVPNKWGEKGATTFLLDKVPKEIVTEALLSAYNNIVNPKTLKDGKDRL